MATLLHHIQLWMQRSIAEAKDRIEKKIAQQTNVFELRFLARPAPTIDLTTL